MKNSIEFVDIDVAESKIENIMCLMTLRDNAENRMILQKFYNQVMCNKGRQAQYVKRGGLISLYVNRVA